jgi:hypothetical protein
VRKIEKGGDLFYTQEGGKTAWLEVVTPQSGEKYVRTIPDGTLRDNLLSLPACPPFLPLTA